MSNHVIHPLSRLFIYNLPICDIRAVSEVSAKSKGVKETSFNVVGQRA